MAEWLVEQGIGEERAICYDNGRPVAARMQWPGGLEAGQVISGTLVAKPRGWTRGRARFATGEEALVDRLPRDASEGAQMHFLVTRSAIGEANRRKLAQVRPTDLPECPAPSLAESIPDARLVRRFPHDDWEEIRDIAVDPIVVLKTGSALQFSATPAMVLVDVDGPLPPRELALAAVGPLARTIRLLDIGGSIGVDFPTLAAKADRKAVDDTLDAALADFEHERTAMNGFGFVQIVSRFERPSMLHLLNSDPAGGAARLALRRAEELSGPGKIELTAHPSVISRLSQEWLTELARRTGKEILTRADPTLAIEAPHAQLVTS